MRINAYIAQATGMSRRAADAAIEAGQVTVNGRSATAGQQIRDGDTVSINGSNLSSNNRHTTIMLNKPVGYVCSRNGQGSKTVYDLLPHKYYHLKPVGRLDKDSSGLILLTNDGVLAHQLTHPRFQKQKVYLVKLNKTLSLNDQKKIEQGIRLEDGVSQLRLKPQNSGWHITMHEGRNRQIRRTFEAAGYHVTELHRISFGDYQLGSLKIGAFKEVKN